MDTIIFLPGFAGSSLSLNESEVWPPTLLEYIFGYNRLAQLTDPGVAVEGVIDFASCYPVYQPIEDDLDAIVAGVNANGGNVTKIDFPFDWRKDILNITTPLLAETIAGCYANGSRSITLVCHSIGGLIARLLLESGTYNNEIWFSSINQFVGICNPHHGAPSVLTEALGLSGFFGISASDMPSLASDPRYPGGCEGLPAPDYNRLRQQPGNVPLDIYTPAVDAQFGLGVQDVGDAQASFGALDISKEPTSVQYFLIAGTQQQTIEQIDVSDASFSFEQDYVGDGTVPLWSAAPGPMSAFVTPGDHLGVMKTGPFRQYLYQILTGGQVMASAYAVTPVVALSLHKQLFAPGEMMSVLVIPDTPANKINGKLRLSRAVGNSANAFARFSAGRVVRYTGHDTTHLSMQMKAPSQPGAYRLTFEEGSHLSTDVTSAAFVVSKVAAPRLQRRVARKP